MGDKYTSKRFRCACGAQLGVVSSSRNRTGTARLRAYVCAACGQTTHTVEIPVEGTLRGAATGEAMLRREILERATPKELLEALKFHLY